MAAAAALTRAGGCGRLYLGDRLLAQGPSWLEGAVLEQLGLCFPRRFPQQMLRDLAESEELQRRFRLFQLQERDRRLLEPGAESPEHEVSGAGWGPPCSPRGPELPPCPRTQAPGEAAEVTVLALSPRCWPVSPLCRMAEPGRFFPAALSSPLGAFAAFCGQSECHGVPGTGLLGLGAARQRRPAPALALVSPGRPELGGREAPGAAVDVAGPCRAALRSLRPARVHAADVRPAALQRRRGRSRGRAGPCPPAGGGSPGAEVLARPLPSRRRWPWSPCCRPRGSLRSCCSRRWHR